MANFELYFIAMARRGALFLNRARGFLGSFLLETMDFLCLVWRLVVHSRSKGNAMILMMSQNILRFTLEPSSLNELKLTKIVFSRAESIVDDFL